jgi:hypothetical protein
VRQREVLRVRYYLKCDDFFWSAVFRNEPAIDDVLLAIEESSVLAAERAKRGRLQNMAVLVGVPQIPEGKGSVIKDATIAGVNIGYVVVERKYVYENEKTNVRSRDNRE